MLILYLMMLFALYSSLCFRLSTYLLLSSWTILTTLHAIGQSLARTIWTST